jgi:hypothetical protein
MAGVEALPGQTEVARATAAVSINGRHAVIALLAGDGRVSTCEIDRGIDPEPSYLVNVARMIGDRRRIAFMGPGSARLALERAYVAIYHRPDRLIDVEPTAPMDAEHLTERLLALQG